MSKEPLLIVACILLIFGCYFNYQGWNDCSKRKERIADDLYKIEKEKRELIRKIDNLQYQLDKKTK